MARKKDTERTAEDAGIENDTELRVYELGFHLDPELSETEAKRTYEKIRAAAVGAGTLVAEGAPVKIQLAYTISRSETSGRRDFDAAYFCWVAYEADTAGHEAVATAARTEANVIRFLDIRTTKEAALHAAEVRDIAEKMAQKEKEEEEAVSDTELDAAIEEATNEA